jgi:hypothetical protein
MPSYQNRFTRLGQAVPKPAGPVIGPPRVKMPEDAGESMPRATADVGSLSSLGEPLKPLTAAPMAPFKGGAPSLFQTSDTKRRAGKGFGSIGLSHNAGLY